MSVTVYSVVLAGALGFGLGCNCSRPASRTRTDLINGVNCRDAAKVKAALAAGASPATTRPTDGLPVLSIAAADGQTEVMEMLLRAGADVNQKDREGKTPLFFAKLSMVADALLRAGADPNARSDSGDCALSQATEVFELRPLVSLYKAGAKLDSQDSGGRTPLVSAVFGRDLSGCVFLLSRGANADVEDGQGSTALEDAIVALRLDMGKPTIALTRTITHTLIDSTHDLNSKRRDGESALMLAVRLLKGSETSVLEHLLKRGADANIMDADSTTPLETAAYQGYGDDTSLLVHSGAKHRSAERCLWLDPSVLCGD